MEYEDVPDNLNDLVFRDDKLEVSKDSPTNTDNSLDEDSSEGNSSVENSPPKEKIVENLEKNLK